MSELYKGMLRSLKEVAEATNNKSALKEIERAMKRSMSESKTMNESREYYILPVENLILSERRELGYYDLEPIARKGLITYIEGTYPNLSDYARNVLDFDLEEGDPMLTLSSEWDEELDEDVVKQGNKWVNKGKEGTQGTFKTKKDALKQTRAMYARGYKG